MSSPPPDDKARRAGTIYAVLAFSAWGLVPAYWKQIKQVPAVEILAHRIVWSLVFTTLLLVGMRRFLDLPRVLVQRSNLLRFLVSAAIIASNWGLYIWAVNSNHVLESSLGYFINPLMSVLFGVLFFKERLRPLQIAALLLASSGVIFLTVNFGGFPWIALSLALSFGLYGVMRKMAPLDSLLALSLESLLLAPLAFGYLLYTYYNTAGGGAFVSDDLHTELFLMGGGVVTAVPLLCFGSAAKRLPLSTVGMMQYVAPTGQFLLAVVVYKEPFGFIQGISFGLIWLALLLYVGDATRNTAVKRL